MQTSLNQNGGTGEAERLSQLYRETIRRHAAKPVGYRLAVDATHRHEAYNPQCGDRVEVMLRVAGDRIEAAAFDGEACAICIASASLLCSHAPGASVSELRQLHEELQEALKTAAGGRLAAEWGTDRRQSGLLQALLGVAPYPGRHRCATLPWSAAERALEG